ncbi:MAG TPA: hypothetical protein VGW38_04205, partial [Chloroflexota bacterium]|nr:hypothetical protein [Chloroflexota bacterium]
MIRKVAPSSRRRILGAVAIGTPAVLLAACGGQAQESKAPAQSAQTGGSKTIAPAQIAFETFRGGNNGVWAEEMIKTFQDKNPQIKVEYRPI